MNKAKLQELNRWAHHRWRESEGYMKNLYGAFEELTEILLDDYPEPKPDHRVDARVQLDDLIYRLPRPIPVRACEVCGSACGAEVCDACRMDATTFWVGVTTAQGRYLSGEHTDSPNIEGYEHAYADAKRGYLRRIEKRRQSK